MTEFALALDIGGSHVTAAVVDLRERLLLERSLVRKGVEESAPAHHLLDTWAVAAHQAHRLVGSPRLTHIGIAIPSPFDYQGGFSLHEHKFRLLRGMNLTEGLRERWMSSALAQVPVLYGNDADLFVLGEWWGGTARGAERVLGVTLGTGLGSGFLERGRVLTHDPRVPPDGELWNTPYRSTIAEDYASGRSIVLHHTRLTSRNWTVHEISTAARDHDPHAQQVMQHFGEELGQILTPWVSGFQPGLVVLGGNIARALDCFEAPLKARLQDVPIVTSTLFEQASLFGGAALCQASEQYEQMDAPQLKL
ncbi:ROK family protein [Deinococcus cellulosilyticus]|uniref:Glucokinase n=1 Tax=Deinococcus cellulosilyticus (strain DSM 18568 / NBRC 106333 / KACC 11606 / 5516J-15) TaxID=1223518 RepID=A0A511N5Y8_DEIC1|nr:ROK family protein [Deinococcus cellulosilyticus]GEM47877.1 glucokinase [Deinococcus cellulosilyticus NBRC 106333 = KACC 11606]